MAALLVNNALFEKNGSFVVNGWSVVKILIFGSLAGQTFDRFGIYLTLLGLEVSPLLGLGLHITPPPPPPPPPPPTLKKAKCFS